MRFYDDLDKAIERLSASKHANPECQADREQLCEWLKELKQLRHPYTCEITGLEVDRPCWECVIYKQLDRNCKWRPKD